MCLVRGDALWCQTYAYCFHILSWSRALSLELLASSRVAGKVVFVLVVVVEVVAVVVVVVVAEVILVVVVGVVLVLDAFLINTRCAQELITVQNRPSEERANPGTKKKNNNNKCFSS